MSTEEKGLIQLRRGNQGNLPTALEDGELALAKDTGRVFVGIPGNINPAGPVTNRVTFPYENVEVLTETTPDDVKYALKEVVIPNNTTHEIIAYNNSLFMEYTIQRGTELEVGYIRARTNGTKIAETVDREQTILAMDINITVTLNSDNNILVTFDVANNLALGDVTLQYITRKW